MQRCTGLSGIQFSNLKVLNFMICQMFTEFSTPTLIISYLDTQYKTLNNF
mgnify:FL=1